jgi:DNA-binding response OmpR family regulator
MTADNPGFGQLIALHADVSPGEFLLTGDEHTLGRSQLCDIVIRRPTISRIHARIVRAGPRYQIIDAGSSNGTYVNGQPLTMPHLLNDRDTIGMGGAADLLRFVDLDPTVVPAGRLRLDERTQTFFLGSRPLVLTPSQQRLLTFLYRHIGELCSREACAEAIWGRDYDPALDVDALDRAISNLRGVLRQADPAADLIKTRRGLGYVLLPHVEMKNEK